MIAFLTKISPPAWGWPALGGNVRSKLPDFPTRVGMARVSMNWQRMAGGFPHPRGDGPRAANMLGVSEWISPPAWGWPALPFLGRVLAGDFPTRVGMAREAGRNS